jgi:Na+-driven multidrug efflux pump
MQTLKWVSGISLAVMLAGVAAFQLIPDVLMGIFENNNAQSHAFLEMGVRALQIISLSFPMAAIGIAISCTFQALGNGIYSTMQSLCRQLVVLLPAAYLLSFAGAVNLVWWAFPIAEVAGTTMSVLYTKRIRKAIISQMTDR